MKIILNKIEYDKIIYLSLDAGIVDAIKKKKLKSQMFKYAKLYAHKEDDASDLAFQKQLLVIISSFLFLCGVVWWLMWYLIFGWSIPTIAAGLFGIMVFIMIIVSHLAKNHYLLIHSVFFGTIMVPVTCQWAIGGLHESGMIIAWAFLTPLGILIFTSIRPAIIYMGIFIACIIITVLVQPTFPGPPLLASEPARRWNRQCAGPAE